MLKSFDDDTRNLRTIKFTRQEVMESTVVCVDRLSLFLTFSLWSRVTVFGVVRGLSDDLEISFLSECEGVS